MISDIKDTKFPCGLASCCRRRPKILLQSQAKVSDQCDSEALKFPYGLASLIRSFLKDLLIEPALSSGENFELQDTLGSPPVDF